MAPNLLESARRYFGQSILPFPFICDPDKRLYAVYGLGDRRALEATRTAVVSFAHAFMHGDTVNQSGAWFGRHEPARPPPHHHAMTAHERGIRLIGKLVIRRSRWVGVDLFLAGPLADLARAHCAEPPVPA